MKVERKWLADLFAEQRRTRASLARHLGMEPPRISEMIGGTRGITPGELNKMATFFNVPAERLFALETAAGLPKKSLEGMGQIHRIDVMQPQAPILMPPFATLPKDVPVYGTVVGGAGGGFHMNGEVVDRVRRPPGLADVKGAFALFVTGDSMEPRYFQNELIYINPARHPAPGDFVVIELHALEGEAGDSFIKRLVRRGTDTILCRQYNPEGDVEFATAEVKRIWRIVPLGEMLGV